MNVGESIQLNTLLLYLLGDPGGRAELPTAGEALESAVWLADAANAPLGAGLRGARVRSLWEAAAPAPARRPPQLERRPRR
jgi:hypothetical protein